MPGLADIANGLRVPYSTTIYAVSGDDTSGIIGILYPSGQFLLKANSQDVSLYWNHEVIPYYFQYEDKDKNKHIGASAWQGGVLTWNGRAGDITVAVERKAEVRESSLDIIQTKNGPFGSLYVNQREMDVVVNERREDTNQLSPIERAA